MADEPTEAGAGGNDGEGEGREASAGGRSDEGLYDEIIWLSTLKAADRLGITPRTLYRFIDRGELPAYRFGRVIRLRLSDVDSYIERCRVEPGSLEHLYPEARPNDPDDNDDDDEDGEEEDGDGDDA